MLWNDTLHIAGVGSALGERQLVEDAVAAGACEATWAEHCGQLAVRVAPDDFPAPEFAVTAARDALAMADMSPADLGPIFYAFVLDPGIPAFNPAAYVQARLGAPRGPHLVTAVSDGCHGGLDALLLAAHYLRAEPGAAAALVSAADTWPERIFNRWDPGADAPFGDGGAAAVLTHRPGRLRVVATATSNEPALEQLYRGDAPWGPGRITADQPLRLMDRIRTGMATLSETVVMDSMEATRCAAVAQVVDEAGVELADVQHVITPCMRQSVREAQYLAPLGIDPARAAIAAHWGSLVGHTGPADPFIALEYLLASGRVAPGDFVLVLADGGGFAATAVLLQACRLTPTEGSSS